MYLPNIVSRIFLGFAAVLDLENAGGFEFVEVFHDEFSRAGFCFKGGAVFRADGLAFVDEFDAVLARITEDSDEAAGTGEQAIDGPSREGIAFADLARPVEDVNAGRGVLEDWDLVGSEFDWHALACGDDQLAGKGEMLTAVLESWQRVSDSGLLPAEQLVINIVKIACHPRKNESCP